MVHDSAYEPNEDALEREGRLAYSMSHPNVVKIYGVVICKGHSLMAMGKVVNTCRAEEIDFEGESLKKLCKRMVSHKIKFSYATIITIAMDICLGMNYIHLCGIVHRDMNLGNFLVSKEDFVIKARSPLGYSNRSQVTDFGLCDLYRSTDCQKGVGAPEFRSPENFCGRHLPEGDVWSFAIVLSRLLEVNEPSEIHTDTTITPEEEERLSEIIHGQGREVVLQNREKALKFIPGEMQSELQPLLRSCLKIRSEDRPDFYQLVGRVLEIRHQRKLRELRKSPLHKINNHRKQKEM